MKPEKEDGEVRRQIEQARGIAYAKALLPQLINTMVDEVEAREEEQKLKEEK